MGAWFERADALGWLVLVPLVGGLLVLLDLRRRARTRRMVGARAADLAVSLAPRRRLAGRLLFAAALLLAGVAALGPRFGADAEVPAWRGGDVVVCLDVSRSMLAGDVRPSRLERAKADVRALATHAQGDRFALVLFAGEARLAVPLTRDAVTFSALAARADPTDIRVGGTDLGAALDTARAALGDSASAESVILLLTDGEDLGEKGLDASRRCRDEGVVVHAVGFGTPLGSKIAVPGEGGFLEDASGNDVVSRMDPDALARIAETTGGVFVDAARTPDALTTLHDARIARLAQAAEPAVADARTSGVRFQGLLVSAFLLFLVALALGDRRRPTAQGLAVLLLASSLAGCGGGDGGRAAFREARTALETGALAEADAALGRVDASADADVARHVTFLRGNVAHQRSLAAEVEWRRPGGDPKAFEAALMFAEDALRYWQTAATKVDDWPAARRNVARALRRIDGLREQRSAGRKGRPKPQPAPGTKPPDASDDPKPKPPPTTTPDDAPAPDDPKARTDAKLRRGDLPAGQVLGLFELLEQKAVEKRELRAKRARRRAPGGRDW